MVRFAWVAFASLRVVAAAADEGACPDAADELEESSLLQRSPLAPPASALLQEAKGPAQPEGFSLIDEAFKFYDVDGDLRITVEDLQHVAFEERARGELLGDPTQQGPFTRSSLKHMISELDKDGNGSVSLQEFDAASEKVVSKMGTRKDHDQTMKVMKALKNLTEGLTPGERKNLTMMQQLQLVRQNAKAARRQGKQAKLQAGWPWSRRRSPPAPIADKVTVDGEVAELYTFGVPAVSDPPLQNGKAGNGRFDGLRIINNDREPGVFWGYWMKTDPITWLVSVVGFEHPIEDVLLLKKFDQMEPEHKPFLSVDDLHVFPGADSPLWHFNLHEIATYGDLAVAQSYWPVVQRMRDYSGKVYNDEATLHAVAQTHGSRLVEFFNENEDSAGLIQDESTLECTLVFSGSDNTADWLNNVLIVGSTFCGFEDVHRGFRAETRHILSSDHWQNNFRTKLPKCSKVLATGHSLGGAIAELFAACANNVNVASTDEDATLVKWVPGKPELLATKVSLMALKNTSSA